MGDLLDETAVEGGGAHWTANLSSTWAIWFGRLNGGYVASVCLRAAGVHSVFLRPSSFHCQLLGTAFAGQAELQTRTIRAGRRSESVAVEMHQSGKVVASALAWFVADDLDGLQHDAAPMPDVPAPDDLQSLDSITDDMLVVPVSQHWEERPVRWQAVKDFRTRSAGDPRLASWFRFRPSATFDSPLLDAIRHTIVADSLPLRAAALAYEGGTVTHLGATMDLAITFHRFEPDSDWLLGEGFVPVASDGLLGGQVLLWSRSGRLLASSMQQLICTKLPIPV